jgi:SAM-dependent methyltransferase
MNLELLWKSPLGEVWNYTAFSLYRFVTTLASKVRPEQKVLDVGAGDTPYKKYFSHCVYTSQDICDKVENFTYSHIDIVSEVYDIPVPSNSYDYILCTQVLEHLKYPQKALEELHRILKPGGQLWLSCPLIWEEHSIPYDYHRFTKYALEFRGREAGFDIISINPQGGRFIALGKMLKDLIPTLFTTRWIYLLTTIIQFPFMFVVLYILYILDFFDKDKNMTLNYEVVYEKKR